MREVQGFTMGQVLAAYGLKLAVIGAVLLPITAHADVKAGVDAWSNGDFTSAVREWQGPAAKGDPDAQFNLAQAYKLGRGVPLDLTRAEALYLSAAKAGHARAADNYGILLFQTSRQTDAIPWLNASAERGEPRAMYVLGIAAYNGDFVARDWVRAYALMTRAAASGLQQAVTSLGAMNEAIPIEQRQQGAALAQELERQAEAVRSRQFAATDLGVAPSAAAASRPAAPAVSAAASGAPRALPTVALPPAQTAPGPIASAAASAEDDTPPPPAPAP
ncbi:tetratricopeptide repeat protein, partial [Novosphingobium sp.]|uniref:tetratricopeptide repeat protein n=1 Tax=Novosphingobium sp. TaxID=1874826 RepID=UPI0038BA42B9